MNHRRILDLALRDLPSEKAAYLARVADDLERRQALEERRHLLYPVLAAAAAGIEPVLEPAETAGVAVALLDSQGEAIAASLYSPRFLTDWQGTMQPWANRLLASLAAAILDRMASGAMDAPERRIWRFDSQGAGDAFPYGDDESEAG